MSFISYTIVGDRPPLQQKNHGLETNRIQRGKNQFLDARSMIAKLHYEIGRDSLGSYRSLWHEVISENRKLLMFADTFVGHAGEKFNTKTLMKKSTYCLIFYIWFNFNLFGFGFRHDWFYHNLPSLAER